MSLISDRCVDRCERSVIGVSIAVISSPDEVLCPSMHLPLHPRLHDDQYAKSFIKFEAMVDFFLQNFLFLKNLVNFFNINSMNYFSNL